MPYISIGENRILNCAYVVSMSVTRKGLNDYEVTASTPWFEHTVKKFIREEDAKNYLEDILRFCNLDCFLEFENKEEHFSYNPKTKRDIKKGL